LLPWNLDTDGEPHHHALQDASSKIKAVPGPVLSAVADFTAADLRSSAQSRNTFFPDRPNTCECQPAKTWRNGYPLVKEALVNTDFVYRYLTRIDLLFMEEMGYWFRVATGTLPCDIDTFVANFDVTVSLGDEL
jgi:hypothetical protein